MGAVERGECKGESATRKEKNWERKEVTDEEFQIELRAAQIWAEAEHEGRPISEIKAKAQAVREWGEYKQKSRKVKLF
jgi:hypothetical protein